MQKHQKDMFTLSIGFALIFIVAILTFFRPFFSQRNQNKADIKSEKVEYQSISTEDLQKKILANEKFTLLDVRSPELYVEEHVLDSINIPSSEISSSNLSDDFPIIIIANDSEDKNIEEAVKELTKKDFKNFFVLTGGISSWAMLNGQTVTNGNPTSFINQTKVNLINSEQLSSLLDTPIVIIDSRPNQDYIEGHIRNAVNIPFEEMEKRRNEIPVGKQIVVYDADEIQGFQAAARVYDLQSVTAKALLGGFKQWKEKGKEIVK